MSINSIQKDYVLISSLYLPGVEKARDQSDGYNAAISGGKFVNLSLTKTFKRHKGKTVKDRIFNLLRNDQGVMPAVLDMNFAVIISACTGNASRGSLWRAVQLSRNAACRQPTADTNASESAWGA